MVAVLQFYSQFWQVRTCVLTWTPPLSPFLPYCFSPCEACATKEEKLTYHCLVYGVVDWTGRRTEDARTWKLRNDETSPLRRLKEKDMTKENFHDTKKDQRCPEENSTMKRTRDTTTPRHGTDATKTTDNNSENNFEFCPRSDVIFYQGPRTTV